MQMKLLALAFVGLATANPLVARAPLCPGIDTPQCCQVSVEGIVDLPCDSVPGSPKTKAKFVTACAKTGTTAKCCTLGVDGLGVICNDP